VSGDPGGTHEVSVGSFAPFAPGTLAGRIAAVSASALASGALRPIPTGCAFIEDGGVRFFVRVLANLVRKDADRVERERAAAAGKPANPFLPWEPDLFVADVSPTHVAILNKFNVVDRHLLVITREFAEQRALLTPQDFDAILRCQREFDSLAFYNGGTEAGASQAHKHLQLVPLPLAPEGPAVPIEPLLRAAGGAAGAVATAPGLDFRHAFVRFVSAGDGDRGPDAAEAHAAYRAALGSLDLASPAAPDPLLQRGPYCLLLARGWMLVVPRSREHFGPISVNSLGFAGALLVRDEAQLRGLEEVGPMAALRATGFPGNQPPA
jgi:ATP adenylyltransferase